ncbi:PTS sugar transporter subunit IIA [Pseudogracilibacillus auburnensis]|uniref:PTS system IIA component (Gat family) n=1 Tax=Pseudogracilibacillus auburnensis TaxID=1494959 RepID=A0A2V3W858_9BACI|nr:PTS sugar transporter subunit IIA [Pseudogracilibacillus auburnensis]MBO1001992.1 PTS sugar transporter subunit IIA [Pseudogracilibacillus auburnensis]PXW90220.1 PTS system IIA component (Gat family) [Pseudogracilibacillus auburnensis]
MNFQSFFHEKLVLFADVKTKDELFELMCNRLTEHGYVKESYLDAIKKREVEYPTGLKAEELGVAIPHTDSVHVNKEAISVAILNEPVTFNHMGMEDTEVEVKVVFMLAIQKPDNQLGILQIIIGMIQNKEVLNKLSNCKDESEVLAIIKQYSEENVD